MMIQMRLSLVVMVAAVVVVKATSQNDCPTICSAIYRPQCGSDGKTYSNDCTLGIAICKDRNLSLKHPGECRATPRPCSDTCPFNFNPVCGSDGKTYGNICQLSIASCNDPSITLKHRGQCQATPRPCSDACPFNFNPVCGSDGKTYGNGCQLSIASCNDPSITLKHRGQCQAPPQQCPTICTMEYNPMCGSDGKTYSNPCDLRSAACRDGSITLHHEGRCAALVDECDQRQCSDPSYQPVCGSDGKTYRNNCAWANAACRDRTLTIKDTGACQSPTPPPTNCGPGICPAVHQPMCGSDGKIYANKCFFNFAKCKNPRLEQGSRCYIA